MGNANITSNVKIAPRIVVDFNVLVAVTYNLRDFLPAARFGISVLCPEQTLKRFDLATSRK